MNLLTMKVNSSKGQHIHSWRQRCLLLHIAFLLFESSASLVGIYLINKKTQQPVESATCQNNSQRDTCLIHIGSTKTETINTAHMHMIFYYIYIDIHIVSLYLFNLYLLYSWPLCTLQHPANNCELATANNLA